MAHTGSTDPVRIGIVGLGMNFAIGGGTKGNPLPFSFIVPKW